MLIPTLGYIKSTKHGMNNVIVMPNQPLTIIGISRAPLKREASHRFSLAVSYGRVGLISWNWGRGRSSFQGFLDLSWVLSATQHTPDLHNVLVHPIVNRIRKSL